MLQEIRNRQLRIVIAISFYIFGFFVMANTLDLSPREILIGLIAGAIGGITSLLALLHEIRSGKTAPTSPA